MEWQSWAGFGLSVALMAERIVRRVIGPPSLEARMDILTETVHDLKTTVEHAGQTFSDKNSETQQKIGDLQLDVRELQTVVRMRGMFRSESV